MMMMMMMIMDDDEGHDDYDKSYKAMQRQTHFKQILYNS